MGKLAAKWYLYRFCIESNENAELLKSTLDHIQENYPYIWKTIEDEADKMRKLKADDMAEEMESIISEIMKNNKGQRIGREETKLNMEEFYKRTWDSVMKDKE